MEQIKKEPKDDWRLQNIRLEFQSYGENKGKYTGTVKFQNGELESFEFKIRPEMAHSYIKLISEDVVKNAETFGSHLIDSLGLKK